MFTQSFRNGGKSGSAETEQLHAELFAYAKKPLRSVSTRITGQRWTALLLLMSTLLTGCRVPFLSRSEVPSEVRLKLLSISARIVVASTTAAVEVILDEAGIRYDRDDLLAQLVDHRDAHDGAPPADGPVIMLVNKNTNDILYWTLTDRIKEIRLKHETLGAIELKVRNESPLRVELWINGNVEDITVEFELKD